jgi:hypothetical protein
MKKKGIVYISFVFMIMVVVIIAMFFIDTYAYAWGNQSWWDTTYSFEYVQIAMPDGSCIEGKCQSWQDYENSDVIQVKVNDKVYLTHYTNVVLVSE